MKNLRYLTSLLLLILMTGCDLPAIGDDDDDEAGDPSLSSLEVIDTSADTVLELTPAFDSAVLDYTASVSNNAVLQVLGTTTQPVFSLRVNGSSPNYPDDSTFETDPTTVPGSTIIAPVDITVGVVSEDSSSLVYTVVVTVDDPDVD